MPRGRPKKPAHAKVTGGMSAVKVHGTDKAPPMPSWLGTEAKKQWAYTVKQLREHGTLCESDQVILTVYCETWAAYHECQAILKKEGRYITRAQTTSKGEVLGDEVVPHPALMDSWRALSKLRQYATDLGLTPAARGWVRTPPNGSEEEEDDFDDFLKDRQGRK